jgi:hypothetical protein
MRAPKKTESLELRLPYETKQAFMARCQAAGVSASEALRGYIETFLEERRPRPARLALPMRLGLVLGAILAVSAVAQPSIARAGVSAGFARMDMDRDGQVTAAEFRATAELRAALDLAAVPSVSAEARLSPDLRARVLDEQFGQIDADRNGRIDLTEFRRWCSGR